MAPDPQRTDRVQRGALLGTLGALAYAVARFGGSEGFVASIDHTPRLFFDFVHYYYASAESLRAGQGAAPGYLYSPVLAIALMPLTSVGLELATLAWAAVQALALALLVLRAAALGPTGVIGGFLAAWLTLLSTAALHSLKWGQVGLILGVLILEGIIALARRRELAGALLLGLAAAIKFYPAIIWPLAAALRRLRAALGVIAVSAVLLFLPPLLVLGERRTIRFYRRLLRALSDTSAQALGDPNSQAVTAWMRREFDFGSVVAVAVVGAALVLLTLLRRAQTPVELGRRPARPVCGCNRLPLPPRVAFTSHLPYAASAAIALAAFETGLALVQRAVATRDEPALHALFSAARAWTRGPRPDPDAPTPL